jgi:hypothetical protein
VAFRRFPVFEKTVYQMRWRRPVSAGCDTLLMFDVLSTTSADGRVVTEAAWLNRKKRKNHGKSKNS